MSVKKKKFDKWLFFLIAIPVLIMAIIYFAPNLFPNNEYSYLQENVIEPHIDTMHSDEYEITKIVNHYNQELRDYTSWEVTVHLGENSYVIYELVIIDDVVVNTRYK